MTSWEFITFPSGEEKPGPAPNSSPRLIALKVEHDDLDFALAAILEVRSYVELVASHFENRKLRIEDEIAIALAAAPATPERLDRTGNQAKDALAPSEGHQVVRNWGNAPAGIRPECDDAEPAVGDVAEEFGAIFVLLLGFCLGWPALILLGTFLAADFGAGS